MLRSLQIETRHDAGCIQVVYLLHILRQHLLGRFCFAAAPERHQMGMQVEEVRSSSYKARTMAKHSQRFRALQRARLLQQIQRLPCTRPAFVQSLRLTRGTTPGIRGICRSFRRLFSLFSRLFLGLLQSCDALLLDGRHVSNEADNHAIDIVLHLDITVGPVVGLLACEKASTLAGRSWGARRTSSSQVARRK